MHEPGSFAAHSLPQKAAVYLPVLRAGASERTLKLLEHAAKSSPVSTVILLYIKKGHSCDKAS